MALSAATVWEVRTTGTDTAGGGFVTGASGTDFSQQDAIQFAITTAVATSGSAVIAITNAAATMVGNIAWVQGGTGSITAGWYQILSVVVGVSITVDRNTGLVTGTGVNVNIGGALLSVGQVAALNVAGNVVFVKSGSYTISSASTNVAGGCVSTGAGLILCGYATTRALTNTDTQPTLTYGSISSATMFTGGCTVLNIVFDGNTQTSAKVSSSSTYFIRCTFKNFTASSTSGQTFLNCYATTNSGTVFFGNAISCEANANTTTAFVIGNNGQGYAMNCIARSNSGASTEGFSLQNNALIINCVSYGNGRDGYRYTTAANTVSATFVNCIAETNSGRGYNCSSTGNAWMFNCGKYNNTSADAGALNSVGPIVNTTGSFFVSASTGNLKLNNIYNQGALARAAGYPASFPTATTTTPLLDIGACQSRVPWASRTLSGGMNA